MRDGQKTRLDWRGSKAIAPSTKRIEPWGWIWAGALTGAAAGALALSAIWRPFDWVPLPPGTLGEHAAYWAKAAAHWALPRLFERDAAFYAQFLERLPPGERAGFALRLALAACAAAAPAALLAKPMLRPRDGLIFLRGSTRLSGKAAVAGLRAELADRVKRRPDHEIAPGAPYPSDLWTRHVLVVGGVGSGKSTAVKPLIDKIVAAGEQMILFDPKGEFTSGFGAPAIVAPWDSRGLAWDLAKDLRNGLDMRRFAATMIRESSDPMWSNASRQLLVGVLAYLKGTRGDDWGWEELKSFVTLDQPSLLGIMAAWHPEAVRAVEKASVTTSGILINLGAFCAPIFDLAEAWGSAPPERRVSFVEWTRGSSPHRQIILQGHGAYGELTRSYVEGIVGVVSAIVNSVEMKDDPNRKLWFVADEFAQMGKVPVRALFEVGRSRGVRCVVACQDFAQLEEIHGAPMVKALVAMCGTILVGQVMQGDTAEQLCKAFGSREVERANVSTQGSGSRGDSSTLSYAREDVPLYKPSELSSRLGLTRDGKGVVLALFTGGKAYELFWPHYKMREERPAHAPAPWTLGTRQSSAEASPQLHAALIPGADPERKGGAELEADISAASESRGGSVDSGKAFHGAGRGSGGVDRPSLGGLGPTRLEGGGLGMAGRGVAGGAFDGDRLQRFLHEQERESEARESRAGGRDGATAGVERASNAGSIDDGTAEPASSSPMLGSARAGGWPSEPTLANAADPDPADATLADGELADIQDDLLGLDGDDPLGDALAESVANECLGEPAGAAVAVGLLADALFDGGARQRSRLGAGGGRGGAPSGGDARREASASEPARDQGWTRGDSQRFE